MTNNNANEFFAYQKYPDTPPSLGPIIITDRLKTAENIGQIIRLAGNIGCQKVLVVTDEEKPRLSKIKRVAEVAGKVTSWQFCNPEEVKDLIPENYVPIALETSPNSVNLFTSVLPLHMALIVGNEQNGISNELLDLAETHLHIPVTGPVKSLNVSQATGVCLYQWVCQHVIAT